MAIISRNYSLYLYISVLIFTLSYQVAELSECLSAILTMKRSRKLSRSGWRDRQKISILVELIVCQENVANALNLNEIILKNKMQFVTFPFFYTVFRKKHHSRFLLYLRGICVDLLKIFSVCL